MRCTATVQRDFTIVIRSSPDTQYQCLRPAVRVFSNGEALCWQHYADRMHQHHTVLRRIRQVSH